MKIATKERSDDCNFHDKRNYQVEAVVRSLIPISTKIDLKSSYSRKNPFMFPL